jgi:hypothetical protein
MTRQERINQAVQDVLIELARAEHLHPIWPGVGRDGRPRIGGCVTCWPRKAGELRCKDANNYAMQGTGQRWATCVRNWRKHVAATALRNLIINLECGRDSGASMGSGVPEPRRNMPSLETCWRPGRRTPSVIQPATGRLDA